MYMLLGGYGMKGDPRKACIIWGGMLGGKGKGEAGTFLSDLGPSLSTLDASFRSFPDSPFCSSFSPPSASLPGPAPAGGMKGG